MADETIYPTPDELARAFLPAEAAWITGDHPTANPDGVTVSNYDYWPKTQEEKADMLNVEMVAVSPVPETEPYPTGGGIRDEQQRLASLARMHSPMELVQASDMAEQAEKNLRAGGSVEMAEVMSIARDVAP